MVCEGFAVLIAVSVKGTCWPRACWLSAKANNKANKSRGCQRRGAVVNVAKTAKNRPFEPVFERLRMSAKGVMAGEDSLPRSKSLKFKWHLGFEFVSGQDLGQVSFSLPS